MEQRQHPYIFRAKAILCIILMLSVQFSLGGCGANTPGLFGMPSSMRVDLSPGHPVTESLKGTPFAGAKAIEVDQAAGSFRVVFDDTSLELSGTFTYVNGSPTVTQLVSTRGTNTATFDLDGDKHVTCISTSYGHKLVMPEEWWTSGAYDDPTNENPYEGANGGLLAYAERTYNGDSGGWSSVETSGGATGSGSEGDTSLPTKESHAALGPAGLVFGVVAVVWLANAMLMKVIFGFLWCICPWLCPQDGGQGDPVPTVGDIPFLGGFGDFTATKGLFQIIISPQDAQGNFIGHNLPDTAFCFQNVRLVPDGGGAAIAVSTVVTGIDVQDPAQGGDVTAVTIFDSSGSMGGNDPGAAGRKAGGNAFFDRITQDDEVAVLDFGAGEDNGLSYSRLLQDFTSDTNLLRAALDQLEESGNTPLYGSIIDGLDLLTQRIGGGGVVVVLTDGDDTATGGMFDDVITQAQAQQTPVYPIGLGDSLDFSKLAQIAQDTGGVFAEASDAAAMERAFDAIGAGVTVGKVSVHGEGTYQQADSGQYKLQGDLLTDVNGTIITTPFDFTVFVP